jgi:ketosteroid isomerase-like protein
MVLIFSWSEVFMSDTLAVGKKLVEFCKEGKHVEAIDALYHPDIVSVEAGAPPGGSAKAEGIAAVKGKGEWWVANHEVHGGDVHGPFPHGDRFIVRFTYDITAKAGPMAGKRFTMDEAALYTVKDGKIVHEEFFYSM